MRRYSLIFFILKLALSNQTVFAVKAYPYPVEITQPDGSKIIIILKGDERIKWAQTVDGYSIMRNKEGIYEYAMLDSVKNMIPSGIIAKNQSERSNSDNQFLSKIGKRILYSRSQVGMMKSISNIYQKNPQNAFPAIGDRKLICILIGFTDNAFTKTKAEFENLFNQQNYTYDGASGSVNDYYKENSYNQLNLTVTVAGPYTAANNMAYYGANDESDNDLKPKELISEAVVLADPEVNYADFDNDNNGYVDGIYVIYAGFGEEIPGVSTNAIWAHSWSINPKTLDGKIINNYSCSAELRGSSGNGINRIGVICHEFGHVMGTFDFYDTDDTTNGSYDGTGIWDVMAEGSWNNNGATPAHHNPYTKIYVYNWATVTTITTAGLYTLINAEQNSNSFYQINIPSTEEYFLIENRQKQMFDTYLPGHGMLIYHTDNLYINSHINSNDINASSYQGFYPVCSNALGNPPLTFGNINSSGCPFPGTSNIATFNDFTTPSSRSWANGFMSKSIWGIAENASEKKITFNVSITTAIDAKEFDANYLGQNYPNPFDQSTTIDFTLNEPSHVKLSVFNALGIEVDVIVDEFLTSGSYSKQWIPKGVSPGIYFYQLNSDGYKETKQLVKQ